jgi:hypothetical protein
LEMKTEACTNPQQWSLEKRYNDFFQLNKALGAEHFYELPDLPKKTLFPIRKSDHLDQRRLALASYLKKISEREDIMNSHAFKAFLDLERRAPEVLIRQPACLDWRQCNEMNNEQFYVKKCLVVEKHNLLVLGLNDAKNENISKLEVHSFKYQGNLRDSFHAEHFNNILRAESLAKDEIFENLDVQST